MRLHIEKMLHLYFLITSCNYDIKIKTILLKLKQKNVITLKSSFKSIQVEWYQKYVQFKLQKRTLIAAKIKRALSSQSIYYLSSEVSLFKL